MQPAIPTRVPHFSRHLAGFRTYPPRYSYLFTLLFTRKLGCMKLPACPPQPIHPLSACTTRTLPFYSLASRLLQFLPGPSVLDLMEFVAFTIDASQQFGPFPAVRIT